MLLKGVSSRIRSDEPYHYPVIASPSLRVILSVVKNLMSLGTG